MIDVPHPLAIDLTWESTLDWILGAPLQILVTVVVAFLARWLAHRAITKAVDASIARSEASRTKRERSSGTPASAAKERYRQRTLTMGSLLRSIATFAIAVITVLTVMSLLGIPLAPLLASAGVGGAALGFGAQALVKDFLSGIFMILEDQYGVGDLIDTGEAVGTVEEVTLRVTRLRDPDGVVWYVRNGEIIRIGNRSQGWSTVMVDIPFSYREDIERVLEIIRATVEQIDDDPHWHEVLRGPAGPRRRVDHRGHRHRAGPRPLCPRRELGHPARDPTSGQGDLRSRGHRGSPDPDVWWRAPDLSRLGTH